MISQHSLYIWAVLPSSRQSDCYEKEKNDYMHRLVITKMKKNENETKMKENENEKKTKVITLKTPSR